MRTQRKRQEKLPHVVRFSGGRSSAMMTLMLLEEGRLDAGRGDVVLFNNTAAEAPATYAFVRQIRTLVEQAGILFLSAEFATAEVLHQGRWARTPTYRLVNERPHSEANPHGFDWRGNTFEELISWSGFTPSYFNRTCTGELKIGTTTRVLCDWMSDAEGPATIGHDDGQSRIELQQAWNTHVRSGGHRGLESFARTKRFVWSRPPQRTAQRFADFSPSGSGYLSGQGRRTNDAALRWPHGTRGYVSVMGLRAEEWRRITSIRARVQKNKGGPLTEYPYMPLEEAEITRADVDAFWSDHPHDLNAPPDVALSNCVYCFLKGTKALRRLREYMNETTQTLPELAKEWAGTPSDWRWWAALEARYARDLDAGNGSVSPQPVEAEAVGSLCYDTILHTGNEWFPGVNTIDMVLCDCTD